MFADSIIEPRSKSREVRPGGELFNHKNCVRVYRGSPETIVLQIRKESRFIHQALTESEAESIIRALEVAIAEGRARNET